MNMHLRYARHTNELAPLIDFYCGLLDLEILGEFHDHDGYDGIFIGPRGASWHLEFTASGHAPEHRSDEDDLLVLYAGSDAELDHLKAQLDAAGVSKCTARNSYWNQNAALYLDPDGFRVALTKHIP